MKIKTLKRSLNNVERECATDLRREARNLNPQYHPMQQAREYTRAVTAAKLDRMFAHPLVGNFGNGHQDSVTCTAISRRSLLPLVSASADGQIKLWDIATRKLVATINGHSRVVNGVVFDVTTGEYFYSCSDDGTIKKWSIHGRSPVAAAAAAAASKNDGDDDDDDQQLSYGPISTWRTSGSFKSIDHHWHDAQFASSSDESVQIWTPERSMPLQTYQDLWGSSDTVNVIRFNPAEKCLLGCCSADRGVGLFDTRIGSELKKSVLRMRCNDLQWNGLEPMNFVVGSDDYNAYSFDMRNLSQPTKIYKGHTSSVMSVSWSPTGREFVTGGYDKSIRIFEYNRGTSREIYHTKRMQRVMTVNVTLDSKFIVSGSDDSNIR